MSSTFVSPERGGPEEDPRPLVPPEILEAYEEVLDLGTDPSFIVNFRRQVVFANSAALSVLGLEPERALGARVGEILGCIHATESPDACGTKESCSVCGAVGAILESMRGGTRVSRDCHILSRSKAGLQSIDALITAAPIRLGQTTFILVILKDRSDASRRQALERIFFHDVLNGLSNIRAGITLIGNEVDQSLVGHDFYPHLVSAAESLIDVVNQQRTLVAMENSELTVSFSRVDLVEFSRRSLGDIEFADVAKGKKLELVCGEAPLFTETDPGLLGRVLLNMLKNALEASAPGDKVTLDLGKEEGSMVLGVHNSAYIPREVQLQIFQRSFSTKGRGRGLGTYSMKVLTEEYLGGTIAFRSVEGEGTRFTISLPAGT